MFKATRQDLKGVNWMFFVVVIPLFTGIYLHDTYVKKVQAQTFGSAHTPDAQQRYSINMGSDPMGGLTVANNVAAHEWHNGSDIPNRKDGEIDPATGKPKLIWPIVSYYKGAWYPSIVWYYDTGDGAGNRFRASNGYKWGAPERWAYIRWGKEVWNEDMQRMEVPDTGYIIPVAAPPKPTPKSLRYIIDGLKIRYTTGELNQAIDESQYNEPSEGAPEEGGSTAPL